MNFRHVAFLRTNAGQLTDFLFERSIGWNARTIHSYLTRGTRLMIHERKLAKTLVIDGPLTSCLATVRATLNELECSIAIQNEGFQNLVVGSNVDFNEVLQRAPSNWYLEAEEARNMGLIEAVL